MINSPTPKMLAPKSLWEEMITQNKTGFKMKLKTYKYVKLVLRN